MNTKDFLEQNGVEEGNWNIPIEKVHKLLDEYAKERAVRFSVWVDSLLPSEKCTVHNPGYGTGLFDKTKQQLYLDFTRLKNKHEKFT